MEECADSILPGSRSLKKKKFKLFEICLKNYKKCKECSTVSISNAFDRHFDYDNS